MKSHSFADSLRNAYRGLKYALHAERNLRFHFYAAAAVLTAAWLMQVTPLELAVLFLAITLVLVTELLNTALEKAVDLYVQQEHPLARIAKDVAAGAVLITVFNAVAIGLIIFGKYLYGFFNNL